MDAGSHAPVFCVLGQQRSGTTWLLDLLDSHPQLRTSNEILNRDPFVRGIPGERSAPPGQLQGFKILEWQNSWWLDALMARPSVPVILQWRSNPVRQLYSSMAAVRTGIYHDKPTYRQLLDRSRHAGRSLARGDFGYVAFAARSMRTITANRLRGQPGYQPEPLRITPQQLDRSIAASERRREGLRAALGDRGGRWTEVTYERLAGPDHQEAIADLLEYLGAEVMPLASTMPKLNDRPLTDLVANYEELAEHCQRIGVEFE